MRYCYDHGSFVCMGGRNELEWGGFTDGSGTPTVPFANRSSQNYFLDDLWYRKLPGNRTVDLVSREE